MRSLPLSLALLLAIRATALGRDVTLRVWYEVFDDNLVTASGESFPTKALRGKYVLLFFGASWCGFCGPLARQLVEFQAACGDHCQVVFVSLDESEEAQRAYMRKHGMTFPTVEWCDRMEDPTCRIARLCRRPYSKSNGVPRLTVLGRDGAVLGESRRYPWRSWIQRLPEQWIQLYEQFDYDNWADRTEAQDKKADKDWTPSERRARIKALRENHAKRIRTWQKAVKVGESKKRLGRQPRWLDLIYHYHRQWRAQTQ